MVKIYLEVSIMRGSKILLIILIISFIAGCSGRDQNLGLSHEPVSQGASANTEHSLTPTLSPAASTGNETYVSAESTEFDISPTAAPLTPEPEPTQPAAVPEPTKPLAPGQDKKDSSDVTYNALYMTEGEDYQLIADSITKHFLVKNKKDSSIRKIEYRYAPKYEEYIGYYKGPILGYKNNRFLFISENKLVVSDGKNETVVDTIEDQNIETEPHIHSIFESDNRVLISFPDQDLMLIYDYRTSAVERCNTFSVEIAAFTDEYLCFCRMFRIPASGGYYYFYTFKDGKINLLGIISGYYDLKYSLDDNILKITRYGDTEYEEEHQVNLETNEITFADELSREQTLYLPTYGTCIVHDLSEIKYINYNHPEQPTETFRLPDYLIGECCYWYGSIYTSLYRRNENGEKIQGDSVYEFNMIKNMSFYREGDSIFPARSTFKELLYKGVTSLGDGEIYLLEQSREVYDGSETHKVTYTIVYAWIPIIGSSDAYQLFCELPPEEDYRDYLYMFNSLLNISLK
jgi:hypothetical protein